MNADKILVVNQGMIAEVGTHDQLIERGGFYANLYEIQWKNRKAIG
jgi:ATP-binding cassette subfamily B protein